MAEGRASQHIDPAAFDAPDAPPVAEVVATYARTIFDVRHATTYTIGESSRASFPLLAPLLPTPRFPLVRRGPDGAPELCFTRATAGELVHAGRRTPLIALIDPRRPNPSGVHTVPLLPDASATIRHGAVTFAVRSVPAGRDLSRNGGIDWTPTAPIVATAVVAALLFGAAFHTPPLGETRELDVIPQEPRFVGYFTHLDEPPREPSAQAPKRVGASIHPRETGRIGMPLSHNKRGHFAFKLREERRLITWRFDPGPYRPPTWTILGRAAATRGNFFASPHADDEPTSLAGEHEVWGARARQILVSHGIGGLGALGTGRGADGQVHDDLFGRHNTPRSAATIEDGSVAPLRPLSLADVRRVLGWRRAALRRCGSLDAASVHFTVNGAGHVRDLELHADPQHTRAAACVAGHLRRTWFPRRLGSTRVVYPLPAPLTSRSP